MFEVEIKIKLTKIEKQKLFDFFSNNESILHQDKVIQEDSYFDTVIPSYARLDKALRVRIQTDIKTNKNEIELTYKGPKLNPKSKTRKEINLELVEKTDFKTIENFLSEIGFNKSYTIKKSRETWKLTRNEKEIHFLLDVNDLGEFLEAEIISKHVGEIEMLENELWDQIKLIMGEIDIKRKITKSYLEMILESNGVI